MTTLAGKTLFITGASRGIGLAIALRAARDGANIVIAAKSGVPNPKLPGTIHTAAAEIEAAGGKALALQVDIREEDQVRDAVAKAVERFGGIDICVNNASAIWLAGTEGTPGPITEQTAESYAGTFDTNVLGVLLSMKHELRVMQAQGSGSIVNLSSTMGHRGAPGASLYTASKHAVEGLTKSAALEGAAFGIRVNAVAPGPVETAMAKAVHTPEIRADYHDAIPLNRYGLEEELAEAIFFLCSDRASYITGQILVVDGGLAMR